MTFGSNIVERTGDRGEFLAGRMEEFCFVKR